jgi:hypothetical protein
MSHRVFCLLPIVLLALVNTGCSSNQANLEKSIREEMKSKMGVDITSFDLKKLTDGSYTGTATAQNGDEYEVIAAAPSGNTISWKAVPGKAVVERNVREAVEKQESAKVKSLELTRKAPGVYSGPAELSTGRKLTVTTHMEGTNLMMKWE